MLRRRAGLPRGAGGLRGPLRGSCFRGPRRFF